MDTPASQTNGRLLATEKLVKEYQNRRVVDEVLREHEMGEDRPPA